jgi:gluconolactonase
VRIVIALALTATLGSAAAGQEVEVATQLTLTEGPAVDRNGNVYFTDVLSQRIMRLGSDGILTTFREKSNLANGLVFDLEGRLIAAEGAPSASGERAGFRFTGIPRVTRTDVTTGKVEVLADSFGGKPLVGPNDVTIDARGRVYFTDFHGAAVYRIDASTSGARSAPGKLTRVLSSPDVQRPNGLMFSPDDRTLYVVEANGAQGGRREIRAFDMRPDGTAGNGRVFYSFYPGRSADGVAVDVQGNIYAAAGMHRTRQTAETLDTKCGVYVISPAGKLLKFIPIPEDYITNTAFGGPDMQTLYITAGKTLYKVRSEIAGLPR